MGIDLMILPDMSVVGLLNFLFVFSLLAIAFEAITGGFVFGLIGVFLLVIVWNSISIHPLFIIFNILGIGLIFLEAFFQSRALFFIAGVICLSVSIFFQFDYYSNPQIMVILLLSIILIAFLFYLGVRKIKSLDKKDNIFNLSGSIGTVLESLNHIYIDGSLWKIECTDPLSYGDKVIVKEQKGLILIVEKV